MLWSQREEEWREQVKSGKMAGMIEPSTCSHPTSARQKGESICQVGKLFEMPAKTLDGEARLLEGGEDPTRESSGEEGDGQKNGRAEEQGFSICPKTASATSPGSHSPTDERSVEKRSTEQARVRSWIRITSPPRQQ